MAKFRIVTPAGASFTTAGGGYDYELEALEGLDAEIVEDQMTPCGMQELGKCQSIALGRQWGSCGDLDEQPTGQPTISREAAHYAVPPGIAASALTGDVDTEPSMRRVGQILDHPAHHQAIQVGDEPQPFKQGDGLTRRGRFATRRQAAEQCFMIENGVSIASTAAYRLPGDAHITLIDRVEESRRRSHVATIAHRPFAAELRRLALKAHSRERALGFIQQSRIPVRCRF